MELSLVLDKYIKANSSPNLKGLYRYKDCHVLYVGTRKFRVLPRILSDKIKARAVISRIIDPSNLIGKLLGVKKVHQLTCAPTKDGRYLYRDVVQYVIQTEAGLSIIEVSLSHSGFNQAILVLEKL